MWCQPQGQARGPWIRGAPLPLPVWGHYDTPALTVDTVEQYEELASSVELESWFTQSDEPEGKKEYNYTLCQNDPDYVEWHERKTRPSALERSQVALIYVARPYLTAIDVTERRNLVYNYRSLLARDFKGHLVAGIYFQATLDQPAFNIFHQTNRAKKRMRIPFSKFYDLNKLELDNEETEMIGECSRQMGMSQENLKGLLSALATVLYDTSFTKQLLTINAKINTLAKDN